MSHLSPSSTTLHRSQSSASIAGSDTTYHSFYEADPVKSASPSTTVTTLRLPSRNDEPFDPKRMSRHDSGYESILPGSRSSISSHSPPRRNSLAPNGVSSQIRQYKRPIVHRTVKSMPVSQPGRLSGQSLHLTMSQKQQIQHDSYFHFPPLEASRSCSDHATVTVKELEPPQHPPPPATTHYWTSDHTRQLEYAAIDASCRGVKGWIMKHVVPDCFIPKESRRVTFDDDTGSVRRYRLELDCDDGVNKESKATKKLGWLLTR
ncbi:hypothetical protein F5Y18DRAFT_274994 [Xylariaceae sp. FL1019]|nr:hypothetical protein F5Y18DRAFT_274994 [Xylariaceae sp. FL1019]